MKRKHIARIAIPAALLALLLAAPVAIRALNEGRVVPVLMYHGFADDPEKDVWTVSTEEFERQLRDMRADGRTSVLPDQLARAARGLYLLPRKPVVITMDDGFRDNVTIAEPIMRKYGMRGICYLIISHIRDTAETRSQYRERDNLVWPEVREALARGTLTFGSHSISHSPVAKRQAREVRSSRHIILEKTGWKTRSYCYPNGNAPDVLWEAVRHKRHFTTAMACGDAVFAFSRKADFHRIPRISVYGGRHAFSISATAWTNGTLTTSISNTGVSMPVRGLLRERGTGRSFLSDGPPVRLGGGKSGVFHWNALPADLADDALELFVSEQNGLFTYGEPSAVPPLVP